MRNEHLAITIKSQGPIYITNLYHLSLTSLMIAGWHSFDYEYICIICKETCPYHLQIRAIAITFCVVYVSGYGGPMLHVTHLSLTAPVVWRFFMPP